MYAGAGSVEIAAHKGRARAYLLVQLVFKVFGYLGYGRKVHAVQAAPQRSVFYAHSFNRAVARALPYTQERAVYSRAAVKPGRGRVGHYLVKIVVPVPFKLLAGHVGKMAQTVNYALYAPGQSCSRIADSVAQRIARPDFYGYA